MSGFNDWIFFGPKDTAGVARLDEVDAEARTILAGNLQTRLRGRIDPGIDVAAALRAQAVRVTSEGDRMVIDSEDQGAVLAASSEMVAGELGDEAGSVEELFAPGSGVPSAAQGADGETKLTFRTISLAALFGEQKQQEQDRVVEQTTTDVLRNGVVDAYDQATATVNRRHPGAP